MNADRNEQALAAWRKLLSSPEIRMGAEEQYDELLKLADEYKRAGVINDDAKRELAGGDCPIRKISKRASEQHLMI